MTELCGNHIGVDPYVPQPPERSETGGISIEGLHHLLVDPDTGQPAPVGTPGEIWVRGYSLMQRLHKREREEVFTPTATTGPATAASSTTTVGSTSPGGWAT